MAWSPPRGFTAGRYDSWLEHFHGDLLDRIDAACADGTSESFGLFRDLDVDLWALLLTHEYEVSPNIRSLLPSAPDPVLQRIWNGASGVALANQSKSFYSKLCERFREHSDLALADARVLDFGCGWVASAASWLATLAPDDCTGAIRSRASSMSVGTTASRRPLVGPTSSRSGCPSRSDSTSRSRSPSSTHISEAAHEGCLRALHESLRPGGILVVTVRPPDYLWSCELMHPVLRSLGPDYRARLEEPHYLFRAHAAGPNHFHFQYEGGEMTYGETVITLPYMRERWSSTFELCDVNVLIGDIDQVMVTLRRR